MRGLVDGIQDNYGNQNIYHYFHLDLYCTKIVLVCQDLFQYNRIEDLIPCKFLILHSRDFCI